MVFRTLVMEALPVFTQFSGRHASQHQVSNIASLSLCDVSSPFRYAAVVQTKWCDAKLAVARERNTGCQQRLILSSTFEKRPVVGRNTMRLLVEVSPTVWEDERASC